MRFLQLDLFSKAISLIRGAAFPEPVELEPKKRRRALRPGDSRLEAVWRQLQEEYFPSIPGLNEYTVGWSTRRQLRTLASCNSTLLRINVAKELSTPECEQWLPVLLYHEMCHAVLADQVRASKGEMKYHGPEFKRLEKRHPRTKELNQWIRKGGWLHAVRSHRAKEAHFRRKSQKKAA